MNVPGTHTPTSSCVRFGASGAGSGGGGGGWRVGACSARWVRRLEVWWLRLLWITLRLVRRPGSIVGQCCGGGGGDGSRSACCSRYCDLCAQHGWRA